MKGSAHFQREIISKLCKYIHLTKYKNCLLQNQWANIKQTQHISSSGKGYISLFNEGSHIISRGDNSNQEKSLNLLLQNHWANFNQTGQRVSLGEEDFSLFNWKGHTFLHQEIITKLHEKFTKFKNILYWAYFIICIIITSLKCIH